MSLSPRTTESEPTRSSRMSGLFNTPFSVPGRIAFEFAVMFSAPALLLPEATVISVWAALIARRRQYPRATVALVMALWCGALGVALRIVVGGRIIP